MKPRGTIGASDTAALFNEHPYLSYYSLWARESGLLAHEDDEHTTRQQIGLDLEKPVLEIWARREGLTVLHNTNSISSDRFPGLSATPDGREYLNGGVKDGLICIDVVSTQDVKTVRPHERRNWLDGIPRHYWWQQQQQTLVCQVTHGYLIALFGVDEIAATRIEADKGAHQKIADAAAIFWKQVRGELPPPEPDDHKATLEALMYQRREPKVFDLSDERIADIALLCDREIRGFSADKAMAEKRLRSAKARMLTLIGDCDRGVFPDGSGYEVRTMYRKAHAVKESTYNKLVRFSGEQTEEGEQDE